MALTIPVLSKIPNLVKELAKVVPNVTFHQVVEPEKDSHFRNAPILIADFDLLGNYLYDLPNVKWVQGTWAGIDKLKPLLQDEPPPYQITRFTGEHFGRIMSEYVVANIVNHERNLFEVMNLQQKAQWSQVGKISNYRIIHDLTVGILGLGNIGNRIGKTLHFLGAEVVAFGRKSVLPTTEDYSHVSKYFTEETLPLFLKECDYIVNTLPKTKETNALLDNDVLENCSGYECEPCTGISSEKILNEVFLDKKSVFINIGRGNIISETSLIRALENKWISAAILDVFDTEPLPKESPLWRMKEIFITPHVAGMSRAKDVAVQFGSNFDLYQKKLPLPAVVDFTKGY